MDDPEGTPRFYGNERIIKKTFRSASEETENDIYILGKVKLI